MMLPHVCFLAIVCREMGLNVKYQPINGIFEPRVVTGSYGLC